MTINQDRGLTSIPERGYSELPADLLAELEKDGHGISFPEPSGCQLRVVREGRAHGGFFAYRHYGGIEPAIRAAMLQGRKLREKHRITRNLTRDHIQWTEQYRRTRGWTEYSYRIYIKVDGRIRCKTFGFGSKRPSPDKQLHAFRTARLFRDFYDIYGDGIIEHWAWFSRWKHVRLYYPEQPPFDWHNT